MKKAYVKPVFFAEEFAGQMCVANSCTWSISEPAEVYYGLNVCNKLNGTECNQPIADSGYVAGNYSYVDGDETKTMTYWEYAGGNGANGSVGQDAFMFTVSNGQCDFLWNSDEDVMGVWKTPDTYEGESVRPGLAPGANVTDFVTWLSYSFSQFFYNNNHSNSPQHKPGYKSYVLVS